VDESAVSSSVRNVVARAAVADKSIDPAICGAIISGKNGVKPVVARGAMRRQAGIVLKEFGLVRRAGGRICGIQATFDQVLGNSVDLSWRQFFGKLYSQAERQIVGCRGYAGTDATAWVQGLDVFNDLLLAALFRLDTSLGTHTLGNIGGVTGSPSHRFRTNFPNILALAKEVHEKRYHSNLAHPIVKRTGRPTDRIPFSFIKDSKILILKAIREIKASGLA